MTRYEKVESKLSEEKVANEIQPQGKDPNYGACPCAALHSYSRTENSKIEQRSNNNKGIELETLLSMLDSFKDVPEFFEEILGESLESRKETLSGFRELGPPDLCAIVKTSTSQASRPVGSYHYVTGLDTSSSAAVAAYINSLTYAVDSPAGWLGGSGNKPAYKVTEGTFCSFNAFSRVDLRVRVQIPGGVEAYVIDARGDRHQPTPELWKETFLSAILRAILYADHPGYRLAGVRKMELFAKPKDELAFLQAAHDLFHRGWQLGSDPEVQVATMMSNHLVSGLFKFFGDAGRLRVVVGLFEKLSEEDKAERAASGEEGSELDALVAKAYIGMNEEAHALKILFDATTKIPQSYHLLHVQCDFVMSRGKYDWALSLAQQAVECAPSEFRTWAKLAECYIHLDQFEMALMAINAGPMFAVNEPDLHHMPTPLRTNMPVQSYVSESGIIWESDPSENEADITLLRIPAQQLKGTFAKAYDLLTKITAKIGWDELLKYRSTAFVMEAEYRTHKAEEMKPKTPSSNSFPSLDDNASTKAIHSPPSHKNLSEAADSLRHSDNDNFKSPILQVPSSPIPTIRVSTESDHERENETPDRVQTPVAENTDNHKTFAEHSNGEYIAAVDPQLDEHGSRNSNDESSAVGQSTSVTNKADSKSDDQAFSNKKLCERWLDSLFLVLYEDLRVYTIWRAELQEAKERSKAYNKTGAEWELLGDIATRLHHREEAKDAYKRCVDVKFSPKAFGRRMEMFVEEGNFHETLVAAIRLTVYNNRWYQETAFPTNIAAAIFKLMRTEGFYKVQFTLQAMKLTPPVYTAMEKYLTYARAFEVEGCDF